MLNHWGDAMAGRGNRGRSLVLVLGIVQLLLSLSWTVAAQEVTKAVLPNGLKVIVKENHASPIVAIDVWVNTGAINESDENSGISHFFEHMLFKGTAKRAVGQIDREIDSLGGRNNAATSWDFTHYYIIIGSRFFDRALEIQADAIMNSAFDPAEIEKERQVIFEEISQRADRPATFAYDQMRQLAYQYHTYKRPVLGIPEVLNTFTRETFLDYYHKYYVPNNITVVIVGDIDAKKAVESVERAFAGFMPRELPSAFYQFEPPQFERREKAIEKDVEQAYLSMGWRAPTIAEMEDSVVFDVMTSILSDGRSSRFYRRIKEEKQLVSSIGAFYLTQKGPSLFVVSAQFERENISKVKAEVLRELVDIMLNPVSDEELRKAKTQIKTQVAFSRETNISQATSLGYNETIAGDYRYSLTYADDVERVAVEDIMQVARKYFEINKGWLNFSAAAVVPVGKSTSGAR
jgi:zinc protease